MNKRILIIILSVFSLAVTSCYDVNEGYRIDYDESSAEMTVTNIGYNYGAIDDTIIYTITIHANSDIKSLVIESSLSGASGTGFVLKDGSEDPFIDHAYGTMQDNIRDIDIFYYYIVGQDTTNVKTSFKMIDNEGVKSDTLKLYTVPSITGYSNVTMYTQNNSKADGFSTSDGIVYHYLPDYEAVSIINKVVQESLDMVFIVSDNSAMLVAPYNGNYWTSMAIKNKTLFKVMEHITSEEFDNLTNASMGYYTALNSIHSKGSTALWDLKVGDIVGFQTDYSSTNSYAYGMLRINAIHPTNSEWYDGKCYVMDMDVVTQISDNNE